MVKNENDCKNKTKTQQCKGKNEGNVTFHLLTFEMFFFFFHITVLQLQF